jgi:hypothetical protein
MKSIVPTNKNEIKAANPIHISAENICGNVLGFGIGVGVCEVPLEEVTFVNPSRRKPCEVPLGKMTYVNPSRRKPTETAAITANAILAFCPITL